MDSDSHKAKRNSFAHHRAHLLFKQPNASATEAEEQGSACESFHATETIASLAWCVMAGQAPSEPMAFI
jgi:hypothetical protein